MKKLPLLSILLHLTLQCYSGNLEYIDPANKLDSIPSVFKRSFENEKKVVSLNRNIITETAINLNKKDIHYHNLMLGGHIITYGLSDRFSISGGFEAFSIIGGESPGLLLASKYSFKNNIDDLHFAIGMNVLAKQDATSQNTATSFYGLTTLGNDLNNLTFGVGLTFSNGEKSGIPSFHLGGIKRHSKHIMLLTDQVLISDTSNLVLVGGTAVRLIWRGFNVDIGIGTDYHSGVLPILAGGYML